MKRDLLYITRNIGFYIVLVILVTPMVVRGFSFYHVPPNFDTNTLLTSSPEKGHSDKYLLPYIGWGIDSLEDAKLFFAPIERNENIEDSVMDIYNDSVGLSPSDFYYWISSVGNCNCSGLIDKGLYYNDTIDIKILNATYRNCVLILTNINYIYLRHGDGVVKQLYIMNKTVFNETMEMLDSVVWYYIITPAIPVFAIGDINVSIYYAGVSSESTKIINEYKYELVNNTLIPVNKTYVELVNPYYKFYIVFNGIRFAYPIIIGIENYGGKPVLKYVKLFLPSPGFPDECRVSCNSEDGCEYVSDEECDKEIALNYTFTVDEHYLEMIVDEIEDALNISNLSLNDLVIADIYYTVNHNYRYIYPYLEVYINKSSSIHNLFVFRLTKEKPVLENILVVAGKPTPSDRSYLFIEQYVSHARRYTPKAGTVIEVDITYQLIVFLTTIFIVFLLIYYFTRKTKQ